MLRSILLVSHLIVLLFAGGCKMDRDSTSEHGYSSVNQTATSASVDTLTLTSTSFKDNGPIPQRNSCQGEGVSPDLTWSGVPANARSLALIVEDPDAPSGMFVHWVLFDIPPTVTSLSEHQPSTDTLNNMARQGTNGAGSIGWRPPCPPTGTHRYFFRIYALDKQLGLPSSTDRAALLDAMKGHVIGEGTLMGTYKKS